MSLQRAVTTLNRLSVEHVCLIASKVINNLPRDTLAQTDAEAVAAAVDCAVVSVFEVCDVIAWGFERGAADTMSGDDVCRVMMEKGVERQRAVGLGRVWVESGRQLIGRLQTETMGAPYCVENVEWRLELETGSPGGRSRDAKVVWEIELGEEDKRCVFETDKDALWKLYEDLERIQNQLDSLTPQ